MNLMWLMFLLFILNDNGSGCTNVEYAKTNGNCDCGSKKFDFGYERAKDLGRGLGNCNQCSCNDIKNDAVAPIPCEYFDTNENNIDVKVSLDCNCGQNNQQMTPTFAFSRNDRS